MERKCYDYFYLFLGLLHVYFVICDFGFVLISVFVMLGHGLQGGFECNQKKKKLIY